MAVVLTAPWLISLLIEIELIRLIDLDIELQLDHFDIDRVRSKLFRVDQN